jgi:hypothetical protein
MGRRRHRLRGPISDFRPRAAFFIEKCQFYGLPIAINKLDSLFWVHAFLKPDLLFGKKVEIPRKVNAFGEKLIRLVD